MKIILICLVLIIICFKVESRQKVKIFSLFETDFNNEWTNFKRNHIKSYRNRTDEDSRRKLFKKNLQIINQQNERYNNGTSSFTYGINRFSDMTSEEFARFVRNSGISFDKLPKNGTKYVPSNSGRQSLPLSVDWRAQGYVNPIKDQGNCGSCWSFSSTSSLEGQYFKTNGVLKNFSEQQLVDCVYLSQGYRGSDADGCNGGFMTDAFDYIKINGIAQSSSYQYTSGNSGAWSGSCKYSASSAAAQITGYVEVTNGVGNEALLTNAIANQGPISVAVYVSSLFQYYSGGLFVDTSCPTGQINHAVTLVGYGNGSSGDYYILRNSWGTNWGDNGYMLFKRNTNGNTNQCDIATYASYPIVKSSSATTKTATSTSTKAQTQSTPKSTPQSTSSVPVATTSQMYANKCYKGNGWYANPGCQTAYYCLQSITKLECKKGYLFDANTNSCKLASQVNCSPLSSTCTNGTGYYSLSGCKKYYYCQQKIETYYCDSGYLLDPTFGRCRKASKFSCPV